MERPRLEVADILRRYGAAYRAEHAASLSGAQRRLMQAITACQNKAAVYNILFAATADTLLTIAADPQRLGAQLGFFAVLHTWGQNLMHHPHLHCVVPGGGLSADGQRWIGCRPGFFLPVRVLSRFFRRRFLELLEHAFNTGQLEFFSSLQGLRDREDFRRYLDPVRQKEWVVYAKPPFAGPGQVLDYVGRYTHRVALSNNRLLDIEDGHVSFRWKDYRDDNAQKTMSLEAGEFIRRFLQHVLPPGLQRIRYYGFMGNRHRREKLAQCRALLQMSATISQNTESAKTDGDVPVDYRARYEAFTGISLHQCPVCRRGRLFTVEQITRPVTPPSILDTS